MHSFADNTGRTWDLEVNAFTVKEAQRLLSIHLKRLGTSGFKPLSALISSPERLVDMLYVLCKSQADKRGISDQDFGRALHDQTGDILITSAEAFVESWIDFFPTKHSEQLRKLTKTWARVKPHITADKAIT